MKANIGAHVKINLVNQSSDLAVLWLLNSTSASRLHPRLLSQLMTVYLNIS